ncbi:transcriptional regulator with XRE-family HTH domain [Kribbella rubisoli]|uniref:Transcriptional regulator with XRE-family HTH domain n=1 Tax=Kribbella rubisoli TaxID=3075929 RepID=A0A4V2FXZ5_9ACTN|nr:XRE family transcriptional regulator [Kribbella rubisoli]RZU15576.1 transcriptional regulator with XRE-family HTH domain [Kribbella rubisoli]
MSDFGHVLRRFRQAAALSQEKLAEVSGVSVEAIKTLEAGRRRHPRPHTLKLLGDGLGLTDDERAELVAVGTRARTRRQVPEQLPDDLQDFSGREQQLADVEKLFSSGEAGQGVVVVSAIAGMGGIGKTALGVHVAHRLADQFPDGQLYLNLRGFGPGEPMSAAEALSRLMDSLGVQADDRSSSVDETAARYRSAVAGRRMFVFVDNAANEAQVLPLLPGASTCAVLITSRRSLMGLAGAVHLALDPLPEQEALLMLDQVVGDGRIAADPPNSAAVVRLCGGLPLALRIAGARLAAEPTWSVADFVQRLESSRRRLDELAIGDLDVRTSIEVSLAAAAEEHEPTVVAFRLLGLYEGEELDVRVAARILELSVPETEAYLERLVDLHLLESPRPRRYQLHDLVRAYVQELPATDAERRAARDRVMALYVAMIWRGRMWRGVSDLLSHEWFDERWLSGTEDLGYEEIMTWLDAEAAEVLAAARRLMAGPHSDPAAVVRLAVGMVFFWADRARSTEGAQLLELAVTALRSDPDCAPARAEAAVRHNLARFYSVLSDFDRAAVQMKLAVETSAASGYQWMLMHSHIGLAQFLERLDRLEESTAQAQAGLEFALSSADVHAEGEARFTVGVIAGRLGRLAEQDREFELAAELARRSGPRAVLWISGNIGEAYRRGGRLEQARSWLRVGLAEVRKSSSQFTVAEFLQLLGAVEAEMAAYGAARAHLEEGLTLIGNNSGELEAKIRQSLGDALSGLGESGPAQAQWRLALQLYSRYGLPQAEQVRRLLTAS